MKKLRYFSLILCVCILLSTVTPLCSAAQIDQSAATEVPDAAAGIYDANASVVNGCHSLDAQMPLCGSGRMLETAGAAVLYETGSDTLMYAWNADAQMYPASLVKIMTALLAVEMGTLTDEITVTASSLAALPANTSTTDLQAGETVTLEQLLYCLMVGSSNDAAVVIAEYIAGSQQEFVTMMNRRAAELGCTGTNFTNPHGLHEDLQVTTARDMAKILTEAAGNEQFMLFFAPTEYTMPATNLSQARAISSTNYMMMADKSLYYDSRVTGGRTGITTDRERCLAVTAAGNGLSYVSIVLGAVPTFEEDNYTVTRFGSYEETKQLLNMGFDGYALTQILSNEQVMAQYTVSNGCNSVAVASAESVSAVLPAGITYDELSIRYQQNISDLTAPIAAGEELTAVQVWYGNVCVAQSPIVAMNAVAVRTTVTQNEDSDNDGFTTFLIVLAVVLGVIIGLAGMIYIVQFVRRAIVRSQHRRRRRERRRNL